MGFKIDITGNVNEVLQKRTKTIIADIESTLDEFGLNTVSAAKRYAPVDEGHLRSSISYKKADRNGNNIGVEITVATNYAAYIEFGTRKFAASYVSSLPAEWKDFAAKFKGKSDGSFEEFVMRLTKWVQRKGIGKTYNIQTRRADRVGKQTAKTTAEADAYAIALHILRNGIRPHPFLYPAVEENRVKLLNNIKKLK